MLIFHWRICFSGVNPDGFPYHLLAVCRSVRLPGHSGQYYRLAQLYKI